MSTKEMIFTRNWGSFELSTDKQRIDFEAVFNFLHQEAYWSKGAITPKQLKKAIDNSLNFGIYFEDRLCGYCRVVSDGATMAYLADVFVLQDYRGQGLSKWMLRTVLEHPDLQNLRRWILLTDDAHELYRQFGWTELKDPQLYMERLNAQ